MKWRGRGRERERERERESERDAFDIKVSFLVLRLNNLLHM